MGGAKNYLVAMPDCDIDKTVNNIITSFSGCTGQRCMAASVLVTVGNQDILLQKLIKLVYNIQVLTKFFFLKNKKFYSL